MMKHLGDRPWHIRAMHLHAAIQITNRWICRVLDVIYERNWIGVVLECCDSDLMASIDDHENGIPHEEALNLLFGLVRGIQYLHHRGIAHIDIKPENCLISHGSIKITDFGACEAPPKMLECGAGTIFYAAP
jgi:serine/threonine protein kinase